jgi:hypothetical protein
VRSLGVLEPPIDELLADLPGVQPLREEWIKGFAPIRTAAPTPGMWQAPPSYSSIWRITKDLAPFDKQPETFRRMVFDNARTILLRLLALRTVPRSPATP